MRLFGNFFNRNNFASENSIILKSLCESIIVNSTSNQTTNSKDVIESLVSNYISTISMPNESVSNSFLEETAYIIVGNTIYNALSSGNYHVYVGILSPIGEDMYSAYKLILKKYKELFHMDNNEYKETLNNLYENIKCIG